MFCGLSNECLLLDHIYYENMLLWRITWSDRELLWFWRRSEYLIRSSKLFTNVSAPLSQEDLLRWTTCAYPLWYRVWSLEKVFQACINTGTCFRASEISVRLRKALEELWMDEDPLHKLTQINVIKWTDNSTRTKNTIEYFDSNNTVMV